MDAPKGLDVLFRPRSIALVGASRDPQSMSGTLLRNLVESFDGPIFPVNPRTDRIADLTVYPSIDAVPQAVDLALIAVPSTHVLEVARACVECGVRALVVITAGFGESGDAGWQRAEELRQLAADAGVPLVGPNCMGLLSTGSDAAFNGTFSVLQPPPGNVAVCSQSGALGFVFPDCMRRWQLGVSKLVSMGNKLCLGENDLLAALEHDPATQVVQLYLESFQDPRAFREIASRVTQHKPIVAIKAGCTSSGQRAAGSHTAALASPDVAADALFRQSGVVRVDTLEELFDVTALLATQLLPRGRRVAVLGNTGGPGVLSADALEAAGLQLPEFSPALRNRLGEFLPEEAAVGNPIDLIGSTDPNQFGRCLELLRQSDEIDATVVIYVPRLPQTSAAIAERVVDVARQTPSAQTLLTVFMQQEPVPAVLSSAAPPIPAWRYPESAAAALAAAVEVAERRARRAAELPAPEVRLDAAALRQIVDQALPPNETGWLDQRAVAALLEAAGIPCVEQAVAGSVAEAHDIAARIGYPVVVKAIAPGLVHRSEVGAVIVDIRDAHALQVAGARLLETVPGCETLLIQKFVACDRECLVGVSREPSFGHLIAFGLGGVAVEMLGRVQFCLHPLEGQDAEELIREHPAARLLEAFRGCPAGDIDALITLLQLVSALLTICPEITEADFNPVKVLDAGHGIRVVDARVRVE